MSSVVCGMNMLGDQIKGLFGIKAPQGNLYRYSIGRFSDTTRSCRTAGESGSCTKVDATTTAESKVTGGYAAEAESRSR